MALSEKLNSTLGGAKLRLVFHFFPLDFTLTVEFTFTLSIVEFSPSGI